MHHGKILGHAKNCLVISFGLEDIVIIATIGVYVLRFGHQNKKLDGSKILWHAKGFNVIRPFYKRHFIYIKRTVCLQLIVF